MSWIIWVSILIVLLIIVLLIGLSLAAWADGYYSVKSEKRGPLIMCQKHGPISERATMDWLGMQTCALCFHEKLGQGERGELG